MTESIKEQGATEPAKLYCRESDLALIAQEGEGTIFIVAGSRPFVDWVEIATRPAAPQEAARGTTIAHQAGLIPEGMPEAEYWRQQAAESAARALVLKRQVATLERRLADMSGDASALTLEQVQDRAAEFRRVLMPMHLTREMVEIISESEWKWEDLLAAAAAITEPQYEEIASGGPAADLLKDLAIEWNEAFVAFKGAFDTPHMRLQLNDEYSNDARSRLRGFDESLATLVANTKQSDDIRKVVNAHCNDLLNCAVILHEDGRFKPTATEIERSVVELRTACNIAPALIDIASIEPCPDNARKETDPLADKAYWEDQGQKEQLNALKD